jgi:hypothetical protein
MAGKDKAELRNWMRHGPDGHGEGGIGMEPGGAGPRMCHRRPDNANVIAQP